MTTVASRSGNKRHKGTGRFTVGWMPAIFVWLWSTGFIGAKYGLPYAEPFTLLLYRMLSTLVVLGVIAWWLKSEWPTLGGVAHTAITGLLVHGLYLGGVFYAIEDGMPAGVVSIIVGLQPLVTAAVAVVVLREAITIRQWSGLVLGLIGVSLVILEKMGKADSRIAFFEAFEENQGIPWVNTLMIDEEGTANYVDGTLVPNLTPQAEQYWRSASQSPQLAPVWQDGAGSVLLPGNSSIYEWVDTGETLTPGLIPFANAPKQTREDYVFNANSSHWLSNLEQPLEGFSILYGPEQTIRSTRTRFNAKLIDDSSSSGLAGSDGRFSVEELKSVMTHNGSLFGNEWKYALTQRCTNYPTVNYQGAAFDLTAACQALINWDGRYNTNSEGAHLMREFLAAFRVSGHRALDDTLFATGFDPESPATTPSGLVSIDPSDATNDPVLQALAAAAVRLEDNGLSLTASLGSLQYVLKAEGEQPIPVSGGYSFEGVFNMAETKASSRSTADLANTVTGQPTEDSLLFALDEDADGQDELAYRINYGSSFVMALQYTDEGPKADMFLSYSQNHDPEGENFKDQTQLYSDLEWRPILFKDEDIAAAVVESVELRE